MNKITLQQLADEFDNKQQFKETVESDGCEDFDQLFHSIYINLIVNKNFTHNEETVKTLIANAYDNIIWVDYAQQNFIVESHEYKYKNPKTKDRILSIRFFLTACDI